MNGDSFAAKHWARVWSRERRSSFLYRSQQRHPERWQIFYNNVGDIWQEMGGDGQILLAQKIVAFVIREQLAQPGEAFLDVGCGPGSLALAFAERGFSVTALDSSEKMVAVVRDHARRRGLANLLVVEGDWRSYLPGHPGRLVLAAAFPQAMNPQGIRRLERLATGYCGLLMGYGKDILPLRRRLWNILMDKPLQSSHSHLACAMNYLLASGRQVSLHRFAVPVRLHLPVTSVVRFFHKYFAIFGKSGPEVAAQIESTVTPLAVDGHLDATGTLEQALIYWPAGKDRQC